MQRTVLAGQRRPITTTATLHRLSASNAKRAQLNPNHTATANTRSTIPATSRKNASTIIASGDNGSTSVAAALTSTASHSIVKPRSRVTTTPNTVCAGRPDASATTGSASARR